MPIQSPLPAFDQPAPVPANLREREAAHVVLKRLTAGAHAQIETLIHVEARLGCRDDYRMLLERFWGLHLPLEAALAELDWRGSGLSMAERARVPMLRADLMALGHVPHTLAALPLCPALPPLDSRAAALGCLYVLEGSTLGGRIVLKQLRSSLGLTPASGAAFYAGHGARTGTLWRAFVEALDAGVETAAEQAAAVESALATFALFGDWVAA
jgi:heme oxygenase